MLSADIESRAWLEANIPKLNLKDLWKDVQLKVCEFNCVPKQRKFRAWFPGLSQRPKDIFRMLEGLNPGLKTDSWTCVNKEQAKGGTQMVIGLGEESMQFIVSHANQLYCGLGGRATFTLVKGDGSKPKSKRAKKGKNTPQANSE